MTPDLEAMAMEVTQGIQNLPSEMPLVAGRLTAVRVYLRTQDPPVFAGGVSGALGGWRGGQFLGVLYPENGPITGRPDGGSRLELDHSLYFYLPAAWTEVGELTLRAMVYQNSPDSPEKFEPDATNNFIERKVAFHAAEPLKVRLIPVHLHSMSNPNAQDVTYLFGDHKSEALQVILFLYRMMPISDLVWDSSLEHEFVTGIPMVPVKIGATVYPRDHELGLEWNLGTSADRTAVNYQISFLRLHSTGDYAGWNWYGMVDPGVSMGNYSGWANHGVAHGKFTPSSSTVDGELVPWTVRGGSTIAHEVAHNRGLAHDLCKGNEETGGALDPDYPYPYPNCSLAAVDPGGYYGFDLYWALWSNMVSGPAVISNDPAEEDPTRRAFPLMGYQNPKWVDPYNYCKLLAAFGIGCDVGALQLQDPALAGGPAFVSRLGGWAASDRNSPSAQFEPPYLLVSLVANPDAGEGRILETATIDSIAAEAAAEAGRRRRAMAAAGGQLELRFENASGLVLERYPLASIDPRPHEGPGGEESFVELFPLPPGTSRVVLASGGAPLDARAASPHAPEVRILRPAGGGELRAPLEIEWVATDADGDELTYTLLYSRDGGDTWKAIATGLSESRVRFPELGAFAASEDARFRVIASDGFHAGEAVTPDSYKLGNVAPQASILGPADGATFRPGQTVVLLGAGMDPEEGTIADAGLSWRSDVDGDLGSGRQLLVRSLSPGRHTITLTARDAAGDTAETAVEILVTGPAVALPGDEGRRAILQALGEGGDPGRPGAPAVLAAALGGAAALGLAAVALIFLRRRRT